MGTTFATKQNVSFVCAIYSQLGAYHLNEGELLKAVSDGRGKFDLYVEWAEGSLGKYTAREINLLAGFQAVES